MKMRFALDVGLLIRGAVRRALAKAKFDLEWSECVVQIEEQKSWTGSTFLVRAEGPEWAVRQLSDWAERIVDKESA